MIRTIDSEDMNPDIILFIDTRPFCILGQDYVISFPVKNLFETWATPEYLVNNDFFGTVDNFDFTSRCQNNCNWKICEWSPEEVYSEKGIFILDFLTNDEYIQFASLNEDFDYE